MSLLIFTKVGEALEIIGSVDTENANGVYVSGSYVADGSRALKIVDISHVTSPLIVSSTGAGYISGVYGTESYVYITERFDVDARFLSRVS